MWPFHKWTTKLPSTKQLFLKAFIEMWFRVRTAESWVQMLLWPRVFGWVSNLPAKIFFGDSVVGGFVFVRCLVATPNTKVHWESSLWWQSIVPSGLLKEKTAATATLCGATTNKSPLLSPSKNSCNAPPQCVSMFWLFFLKWGCELTCVDCFNYSGQCSGFSVGRAV